jgi:hypothetical protein
VVTWHYGFPAVELDALRPDLVVLSPGPGEPADFDVSETPGALPASVTAASRRSGKRVEQAVRLAADRANRSPC